MTAAEPTTYRVTAAYVTVKMPSGGLVPNARSAMAMVGFYKDAILPGTVEPESLARLVAKGMVEAVETGALGA